MGTPLAVSYANIFMNAVDQELATQAPFLLKHFRFIDDNLFLVPRDKVEELKNLTSNLGFPTIKFTWVVDLNNEGISFLDVWMQIISNVIQTRLFTKPTDRHLYLHPLSFHPKHILTSIPYSILSRVKRLCSLEAFYVEDKNKALMWLRQRGYNETLLQRALYKVDLRTSLQHITEIEEKHWKQNAAITLPAIPKTIPLILTYNTKFKQAPSILHKYRHTLAASLKNPHRTLIAFRRNKNLTDLLVHPSYRLHIKQTVNEPSVVENPAPGFPHCNKTFQYRLQFCLCGATHTEGCRLCAHSIDGLTRLPKTQIKVLEGQEANCHTRNLVYAIWCRACSKIYVGETTQPLSVRFEQHLRLMRSQKTSEPLYLHFNKHHPSNAFVLPLEVMRKVDPKLLKIKESNWINRLGTLIPHGLNNQLDLNQKYVGLSTTFKQTPRIWTPTPAKALVTPISSTRPIPIPLGSKNKRSRKSRKISSPVIKRTSILQQSKRDKRTISTPSIPIRNSGTYETNSETTNVAPTLSSSAPKVSTPDTAVNTDLEPFVQISPYVFHPSRRIGKVTNLSVDRLCFEI